MPFNLQKELSENNYLKIHLRKTKEWRWCGPAPKSLAPMDSARCRFNQSCTFLLWLCTLSPFMKLDSWIEATRHILSKTTSGHKPKATQVFAKHPFLPMTKVALLFALYTYKRVDNRHSSTARSVPRIPQQLTVQVRTMRKEWTRLIHLCPIFKSWPSSICRIGVVMARRSSGFDRTWDKSY